MSAEAISENRAKSDFWQGVRLSMPVVVAAA
ncbi:MAG: branched-chain amino acid ABC transporter permease, partial [Mesorhizobium sp.]